MKLLELMRQALVKHRAHKKRGAMSGAQNAQEMLRLIEAGIRYGWASRGIFEMRLTQGKVAANLIEIVQAYNITGLKHYKMGETLEVD